MFTPFLPCRLFAFVLNFSAEGASAALLQAAALFLLGTLKTLSLTQRTNV